MISEKVLINTGFKKSKLIIEQELRYITFDYSSNGSYISVCNILNENNIVKDQVFTINDREIPKKLSRIQLKNFINIIN